MTNTHTIREIQRLMDECRGAADNTDVNERRIARLLGADAVAPAKDEGGRMKDEVKRTEVRE